MPRHGTLRILCSQFAGRLEETENQWIHLTVRKGATEFSECTEMHFVKRQLPSREAFGVWRRRTASKKPNFDREGNEVKGVKYWVGMLAGLGSESMKAALMKWFLVVALAFGAKKLMASNSLPSYLR